MASTPQVIQANSIADNKDPLNKMMEALKSGDSESIQNIDIQEDFDTHNQLFADNKSKCKWSPTSWSLLHDAETRILSFVKTAYKAHYVNVGQVVGKEDSKIWTLSFTENGKEKTPLVMLHGMGSGVGFWALNFDELAADRHVHAFDMLGFAKSSRPKFSTDAALVEKELVDSIEEWRKEMKLEKFVLLGHSMGGYLVTSYAMRYPERVAHLILADPWGFPHEDPEWAQKFPLWMKMIAYSLKPFNPLVMIRATGPMGPKLIKRFRTDLIEKYSMLSKKDESTVADYIYHCNAQTPSGEAAFHSMSHFVWAKNPMQDRLSDIPKKVPITLIYGGQSWIRQIPDEVIRESRPTSYVDIQRIPGAGHHIMADNWEQFNSLVLKASRICDELS